MRRTFAFISIFALMISMLALPAGAELEGPPAGATVYTGQGMPLTPGEDGNEKCGVDTDLGQDQDFEVGEDGGYLKWVFTGKTSSATLVGPWGSFAMIPVGQNPSGDTIFHKATDYYPLEELISAKVWVVSDASGQLTVSNGCPGDDFGLEGAVTVTKTAIPSFTRTHKWDIEKSVTTEDEFVLDDGTPKVWLYTDDSGNETATWKVDVTYKGFEDSDFAVTGTVTIGTLGSDYDAHLDSLTDSLGDIEFECVDEDDATFAIPGKLAKNSEITCSYTVDLDAKMDGANVATVTGYFVDDEGGAVADGDFDEDSEPAPYMFGDPTTEKYAEVRVQDRYFVGGVFDTFRLLGALNAAELDKDDVVPFEYEIDYAYADFDECGAYHFSNQARIRERLPDGTAGAFLAGPATADLKVNVQCFVFEGDTVTGAGDDWSAIRRAPNTWFQYTVFDAEGARSQTFDLVQGRPLNDVGEVIITKQPGGTALLEFSFDDPYELADVGSNVKVEPLDAKPTAYIPPGRFSEQFTRNGSSFSVVVPQGSYGYAIHLDAGQWVPDPGFGP